eukprot:Phypoly_transcript_11829.p1 GENE.Phypoly_transcript_11829~~Phypoly_transcript_11829.p1  ORF type:complete len:339 (+),score=26.28 Phypoly_transcript_11829:123-1139(+)
MRCISEITTLEYLESNVGNGKKIHEMFDLICGSGFGGLLAIAIGVNQKSHDDCRRLFHDLANEFGQSYFNAPSWFRWMRGQGVYSTDAFTKILERHLGDLPWQTLSWLNPKVCVVSGHSHLNGKTTTSIWRTYASNTSNAHGETGLNVCQTYQAARATASMPGYFEPFVYGPDRLQFVDGSVVESNPTEIALFEAAKLWPGRPIDVIVSVGCGVSSLQHPMTRPAVLHSGVCTTDIEEMSSRTHFAVRRWVDIILSLKDKTHSQNQSNNNPLPHPPNQTNSTLPTPIYVRLDPPVGKPLRLNEFDMAALRAFEERTNLYLEMEAREEIQRLRTFYIHS